MRPVHVFALAVGLLALGGAAGADEKADQQALKELEGTYLVIGLEAKGLKLTEGDLKKVPDAERQMVIKGDQIVSRLGGKEEPPTTIKVDAGQKPAHINLISAKGGKTEVSYGIYKLEDGVLTICATVNAEAKDRPKEFKADDKGLLLILKRQAK